MSTATKNMSSAIGFAGALSIAAVLFVGMGLSDGPGTHAYAAEDGHSSGGDSGGGHDSGGHGGHSLPRGHSGGHDSGSDSDHGHADGDDSNSDHEGGRKGGSVHGGQDARGHSAGGGRGASLDERIFGSGRPVWAQEGIPEVELGRLNVGRAPRQVLERAEAEALSSYTDAMAQLYNLNAEDAAALLQQQYRDLARIDSPLQNLALYKDVMTFGRSQLPGIGNDPLELAAIFLGSAADKNMPVSEDTVIAINRILGLVDLGATERATLAAKANRVREAILIGHGPDEH